MNDETRDLSRIISASERDMLDAYRIQAQSGPVTDEALEEILFRAAHGIVQSLAPHPAEQRVALLPSVVRMLLAAFLEDAASADGAVQVLGTHFHDPAAGRICRHGDTWRFVTTLRGRLRIVPHSYPGLDSGSDYRRGDDVSPILRATAGMGAERCACPLGALASHSGIIVQHELLTLWFLRLNGYFCVPNFIVHPDAPGPARTDADLLAVRFPHCREVAGAPMPQDVGFMVRERIDFVVAEVKAGVCSLNGPWVNPGKRNIQYVLQWMGFLADADELEAAATELYHRKQWQDREGLYSVRVACFGKERSDAAGMREVLQRTHRESVEFIKSRFRRFGTEKADQRQWDRFIRHLFEMAWRNEPTERIMAWIDGRA